MHILFFILLYLYGITMSGSSIIIFMNSPLPLWIIILNCMGSLSLFLTPTSKNFFYSGIILLIIAAIFNGLALNGHINPIHLFIRVIFSLFMLFLYRYINN